MNARNWRVPGLGHVYRAAHRLRCWATPGALILNYHRVASLESDPWNLAVSPGHFEQHLEVIRRHAQPMPLMRLVRAHERGRLPRRVVVVTLDDGYADNLHVAKPLLARHEVPATVFVTTGQIGQAREFWWDELDRLLLQPGVLPEGLELRVAGRAHRWDLGEAAVYTPEDFERHRREPVWKASPGTRAALYHGVYTLVQPLSPPVREEVLAQIAAWAGIERRERVSHHTITAGELHALADGGLVDIGAHSINHPSLPAHSHEIQRHEMRGSRQWLERALGRPIESFAYPHGNYTSETVDLARQEFACACSTTRQVVRRDTDRYRLPRCVVQDWDGDEFARRLVGWFQS